MIASVEDNFRFDPLSSGDTPGGLHTYQSNRLMFTIRFPSRKAMYLFSINYYTLALKAL